MKKTKLFSLFTLPIIITPIVTTLVGCAQIKDDSLNIITQQAPKIIKEYLNISTELQIFSIDEFKKILENATKNANTSEITKLVAALGISFVTNNTFVLNNSIKIINNNLQFVLANDTELDKDSNGFIIASDNAKYYNVILESIDVNSSTIFPKQPDFSTTILDQNIAQQANNIITLNVFNQEKTVGVDPKNVYYIDSQKVQNVLKTTYDNVYNQQLDIDAKHQLFKTDLEYALKTNILNNINSWNQNLINTRLFLNVKTEVVNDTTINFTINLQLKNTTLSHQKYSYFKNDISLKSGDYLTIKSTGEFNLLEPTLSLSSDDFITFSFKNTTTKCTVNNQEEQIPFSELIFDKSIQINTKLTNISHSQQTPYTQDIANAFTQKLNSVTNQDIKEYVTNYINNLFKTSKEIAIANSEIANAFYVDETKPSNYSFYDALTSTHSAIETLYTNLGYSQYAKIISLALSDYPLYKFFYLSFDSILSLLAQNSKLAPVYKLLYDNLTINGIKKSEDEFRNFFENIKNIKPVIVGMFGSTSIEPYYQSYILDLVDNLANVEQSLIEFVADNLFNILTILEKFAPSLKPTAQNIKKVEVIYNGKKVNNILKDMNLYDFLAVPANKVQVNNPIQISPFILAILSNLELAIPLFKPLEILKPILPVIQLMVNGIVGCLTGKSVGNKTVEQYKTEFERKAKISVNQQPQNVLDYLKQENNYKITNLNWVDTFAKTTANANNLNSKLTFDLSFTPAIYSPKNKPINLGSISYELIFNNESLIPRAIEGDDKQKKLVASINAYANIASGTIIDEFSLPNWKQDKDYSINIVDASNKLIEFDIGNLDISQYVENVIYEQLKISFPTQFKKALQPKTVLYQIDEGWILPKIKKYYVVTDELEKDIIEQLKFNSELNIPTIDLNWSTLKPRIQIYSEKSKWYMNLIFPSSVLNEASEFNTTFANIKITFNKE